MFVVVASNVEATTQTNGLLIKFAEKIIIKKLKLHLFFLDRKKKLKLTNINMTCHHNLGELIFKF
jgi:hypothetical protein